MDRFGVPRRIDVDRFGPIGVDDLRISSEGIASLQLGDTNDVFTVVKAGLKEGDEVVLHPFAFKEAQALALKPRDEAKVQEPESTEPSGSPGAGTKPKSPGNANKQTSKPQGLKPKPVDSQSITP